MDAVRFSKTGADKDGTAQIDAGSRQGSNHLTGIRRLQDHLNDFRGRARSSMRPRQVVFYAFALVVISVVLATLIISMRIHARIPPATTEQPPPQLEVTTVNGTTDEPEVEMTPTPQNCGKNWTPFLDRCYMIVGKASFVAVDTQCLRWNAHLASVHGIDESKFLTRLVNAKYVTETDFYIGLQRNWTGHWEWSDGSHMDFMAWGPNEPNATEDGEHCMKATSSYGPHKGKWADVDCASILPAVCMRHVSSFANGLGYATDHYTKEECSSELHMYTEGECSTQLYLYSKDAFCAEQSRIGRYSYCP